MAPSFNTGAKAATALVQGGTCTITVSGSSNTPATCSASISSPATACIAQYQTLNPQTQGAIGRYNCIVSGTTVTVQLDVSGSWQSPATFAFVAF
jgi:hypothetical protein